MRGISLVFIAASIAFLIVGCTAASTTNTARTSTEQMLIANSIDQALDKIDFSPFSGQSVFVADQYVDCVDSKYLIASVRHRILRSGGTISQKPEDARVYVELRNGAVGTESSDAFLGVPEVVLPGVVTLPEVRLVTRTRQHGLAKIGLVALDTQSGTILGDGGITTARSDVSNYFVMGVGPWQTGTVRQEMSEALAQSAPATVSPMPNSVAFSEPQMSPLTPGVNSEELQLASEQVESTKSVNATLKLEPGRTRIQQLRASMVPLETQSPGPLPDVCCPKKSATTNAN